MKLVGSITLATPKGDKQIASTLANSAVDNLNTVLDSAEGVIRDVDNAAADVQSALGLNSNGGLGPL